jgi:hypothetical protein
MKIGMFHMTLLRRAAPLIVLPLAAAILSACGGGGGSGAASPPPPMPAGWVQGQFAPESNFAAMCVTRTLGRSIKSIWQQNRISRSRAQ